jgi:hypothetical protein
MTPGEGNADGYDGYLTNRTINGQIAQQQNCATIVLEHRFYGLSNPYPDLSVKSLRVHTIQQAIDDFDYFAKNVNLPMPGGDKVKPDTTPWVLVGGSYSGALTSFIMVKCVSSVSSILVFHLILNLQSHAVKAPSGLATPLPPS